MRPAFLAGVLLLATLSFGASCRQEPAPQPKPDPTPPVEMDTQRACSNLRQLGFKAGESPACEDAIDKTGGIVPQTVVRCWAGAKDRAAACGCSHPAQIRDCP